MQVLRTVQQHRRLARRTLALSLAASMGFVAAGLGWWLGRPGVPVTEAYGLTLPPGTRLVFEEHGPAPEPVVAPPAHVLAHSRAEALAADDDKPPLRPIEYAAMYLAAAVPLDVTQAQVEGIRGVTPLGGRRYRLPDGLEVALAPARDVPATRLAPVEPVSDGVPLGTRSWIIVSRGEAPASTGTVSVPPYGES